MLCLARKQEEIVDLFCGDTHIVVKVLETSGKFVRLGFEAPREVIIARREVVDAKYKLADMGETSS